MKTKKWLLLALCLLLVLALVPVTVHAEATSGKCGDNLTWSFNSSTGKLTITGSGEMDDSHPWSSVSGQIKTVALPSSLTSIGGSAFSGCTQLASITIPSGVTVIGDDAFSGCTALGSVTLPNSVEDLGARAFSGCSALSSVNISSSLFAINPNTFSDCTSLQTLTLPDSLYAVDNNAFSGCTALKNLTLAGSLTLNGTPFAGCTGLKKVTFTKGSGEWIAQTTAFLKTCGATGVSIVIGSGVKKVPANMFANCTAITSVSLPSGLTTISSAFKGCKGLKSITIPSSVTSVGGAFSGCTGLTSATIQNSVIGGSMFSGCTGLNTLTISNSVTSIGNSAFSGCTGLTSVTVPASVTTIGGSAFSNCTGLTSVTLSTGLTDIQASAFSGCTGLTSVTIPQTVTHVGNNAFLNTGFWNSQSSNPVYKDNVLLGCKSDPSVQVTIKSGTRLIADQAFYEKTGLAKVTMPNSVISIGEGAFAACTGLKTVTMSTAVTSIGASAFSSCTRLTAITIPSGVTQIASSTFYGCASLTSIIIPDSVTSIGLGAFNNCSGLTKMTVPCTAIFAGSISELEGSDALTNCKNIKSVTITAGTGPKAGILSNASLWGAFWSLSDLHITLSEGITKIGDNDEAFARNKGLTSITIPNTVSSIGMQAFHSCTGLKSITIPDSVTYIDWNAFSGCTGLTSVTIRNSTIGNYMFSGCTGLTSVTIQDGVTTIGEYAFSGCTGLTSINIPDSVTSVGDYAFYNCKALKAIPSGLVTIGNEAFYGCTGLTAVTISNNATSVGRTAFGGCTGLKEITIPSYWNEYGDESSFDGCVNIERVTLVPGKLHTFVGGWADFRPWSYSTAKNMTVTLSDGITAINEGAFKDCTGLTSITIPNSVTSIGGHAFESCRGLTSITIPNSVTSIEYSTFYGCTGLTSVTIPNSVTSIDNQAFSFCRGLTSITIPNSVTSIEYEAFGGCSGLTSVTIPNSVTSIVMRTFAECTGLTSVTIGNGVTDIGEYAFDGCTGLTSVTIPNSVTCIQWYAFSGCAKLRDVYYLGTQVQKKCINFTRYNDVLLNATWHYLPEITTQPASVTVTAGKKATFSVVATDADTYQWQWSKDGKNWTNCTMAGADTDTIEIVAEMAQHGYQYRCEISNDMGTATSDAAKLTIQGVYTVILNANGGTCTPTSITVIYGNTYAMLPTPAERTGYNFDGWWTTKATGGKQVTKDTVCYATGNFTLYARWKEAATHTVTLNANGGSCSPASITVTYGNTYAMLPTPAERTGYNFDGWWTTKSTGGKQVTKDTVCYATGSFTLYARWAKSYTVTLNPNGGSVSPTTKTVTYGKAYSTLPTPTRSGYTFDGWWTAKEEGKEVNEDTVCYASGNYTLFARWLKNYTVTLDPNGGTCGTSTKTVTYGTAYGTMPVPTRKGYTFAGWWTAKDAGGKKVTASTICYATGNYTLYARWTEGYTMTFDPNGGTVSPTTKVVKYGQQYGTLPTPTKAGYTFTGWWTATTGGKKVTASTVCYASAGYTLHARWTAKKFVVTLNPNGGECATKTKTVTYGQAYGTMPVPSPRTGYTFAGWYTAKTGGKKVTATTICYATGNYTLYARWTPKTYTVTLNPNGGTCTAKTKTVTYGQTYGTLPTPTRSGYTFAGWWTKKDTGGKQVFSSTTCYATGNYTLYARWTKN